VLQLISSGEITVTEDDSSETMHQAETSSVATEATDVFNVSTSSEAIPETPSVSEVHSSNPSLHSSATSTPEGTCSNKDADWNFEVNSMFLPAAPSVKRESVTKQDKPTKRNSFHRLLTSEEILEQKRAAYELKCSCEQAKSERRNKRLAKSFDKC